MNNIKYSISYFIVNGKAKETEISPDVIPSFGRKNVEQIRKNTDKLVKKIGMVNGEIKIDYHEVDGKWRTK